MTLIVPILLMIGALITTFTIMYYYHKYKYSRVYMLRLKLTGSQYIWIRGTKYLTWELVGSPHQITVYKDDSSLKIGETYAIEVSPWEASKLSSYNVFELDKIFKKYQIPE